MSNFYILFRKAANFNLAVFLFLFLFLVNKSYSQIGLGAQTTLNHPGLLKSEKYDIRFNAGSGYGFFVRHDVYDSSAVNIDFRYSALVMSHEANLPQGETAKYDFSNFSIDALVKFANSNKSSFYAGVGIGLLSLLSKDRFRETYSDQTCYPVICGGWAYKWAEGVDLFMEIKTGYGESGAGPERIPVSSLAFNLGLTMYITE